MCFGGGADTSNPITQDQLSSTRAAFGRVHASGEWDPALGNKPDGWDTMTAEQKRKGLETMQGYSEGGYKAGLGPEYVDPTGKKPGAAPDAPDLTDQLLQKTRTNFALRLQAGNNQRSSFSVGQLGGSPLSKPVLGGY